MNTGVVSMRFAKALLAYAKANGKEGQVYEEMKSLASHYTDVPDLRRAGQKGEVLAVHDVVVH